MFPVRTTIGAILAMAAIVPVGAAQQKGDLALLEGKWAVTRMVEVGALKAEKDIAGMSFTFSKSKVSLVAAGEEEKLSFTFTIDAAKKPKAIDMMAEDGPLEGETRQGIYQLDGDALLLCFAENLQDRPDAFESLGGVAPPRILLTLKRVKQ